MGNPQTSHIHVHRLRLATSFNLFRGLLELRFMMTAPDPYCDHLASPNKWVLSLSICLVIGILLSYLPQHLKIINNRTSAGLSPWWVLLGTLSSTAAIANVVVLPTTQHDMACCRQISGAACASALLGVVQIGVQWLCFMVIMILFLTFFPRRGLSQPASTPLPPDTPRPAAAITVGATSLLSLLLISLTSAFILLSLPSYLLLWANILGLSATALSSVQYIPQLITTWRLKRVGSLSITTMAVQVPGAFLFAFSLWLRVGWQGWSTWCVYCVTGCLQAGLLGMAVSFNRREKEEEAQVVVEVVEEEDGEREALLSGQRAVGGTYG